MNMVQDVLKNSSREVQDQGKLAAPIASISAAACGACADACLGEQSVQR